MGRSWHRTDVNLPLGRKYLWRYADVTTHAVGPGQLQAIAMSDAPEDLPLYMWELWRTDDEQHFQRVAVPWERLRFGGMAFASDGALLIAEVQGSDMYCDALACNRPGRIWRLAPGRTEPKLLPGAPRLFGPFWAVGIHFSGGSIVARTGLRTIALSDDGYTWTRVTPGRKDVSAKVAVRNGLAHPLA